MNDRSFTSVTMAIVLILCCTHNATSHGDHKPTKKQPSVHDTDHSSALRVDTRQQRYTGPLSENPGGTAFSADLHVHGSFSEGSASMMSTTAEDNNVGLDVVWWSDHDGFFTHWHMISTYSFEDWVEPASTNEQWVASTNGEANQTKSVVLESIDPMEYDDAQITPEESYTGAKSLKLSCASTSSTEETMMYKFDADTKRNKRTLGSDVSVGLAVFPEKVTTNARGVIEIIMSLHEPASSANWEQYKLRYFLHPDPLIPRYRDGAVYNIPVSYQENQWNLLDLQVSADAVEGFSWLTGIDNNLFQLNIGVESSMGDTAVVFFDDLEFNTTLAGNEVLDVQRVIMDSLEARMPDVFQLQSVETHWKHMNIFGDGFDLPNYDSIALAGGFIDQSGWIQDTEGFETYCARAVAEQAHARGSVVSYNHMFGASTGSTGGPDPQSILDELASAGIYGADLLEVGYVARGGQTLDNHLWVWDELAKRGLFPVGVGVTDAHSLFPGDWATRQNRLISWIYSDEPTRVSLVEGLKRGRVYFGDLTIFNGTVDLTTSRGFMMGQLILTDQLEEEITISIDDLVAGDLVKTYWDGELVNTYVASQSTFSQTEVHQLDSADTFMRVAVTTATGANKAFSNPLYLLRKAPVAGIASPRVGLEIGNIHSTLISDFTLTNASRENTAQGSSYTIEGTGNDGVIILNFKDSVTPDSVRFESMTGSWELLDTLLVLSGLTGTGLIEVSGGSPGIHCGDIFFFNAKCNANGAAQAMVKITGDWTGSTVTFDLDGDDYVATLLSNGTNSIGKMQVPAAGLGSRTVTLDDPAGCYSPVMFNCQVDAPPDPEWDALWAEHDVPEAQALKVLPAETRIIGQPVLVLAGNYPNPFNPSTTIRYALSVDSPVSVRVYNMLGQEVATLVDGFQKAGEQSVVWHGVNNFDRTVASGLYIYRLRAGNTVMTQKMLFTK